MHIERSFEIDAPIDLVWEKISDIGDIQNWTRTVNTSYVHTETTRGLGAGRTCDVRGIGTLVEHVLEWDEGRMFRLSLEGLPFFVGPSSGGWRLEDLGDGRTRATTFVDMTTRFWPLGALMERFAIGPQFTKAVVGVQKEFKDFVEAAHRAAADGPQMRAVG